MPVKIHLHEVETKKHMQNKDFKHLLAYVKYSMINLLNPNLLNILNQLVKFFFEVFLKILLDLLFFF